MSETRGWLLDLVELLIGGGAVPVLQVPEPEPLQFPHCDSRVLHAESDGCSICNEHYSEWQQIRRAWGIAFTGHSDETEPYYNYETGKMDNRPLIPCPSERDRTAETIHMWHGNQPYLP